MRIWFWLPLVLLAAFPIVRFLLQRRREARTQRDGVVVYATVISMEPVKVFGKPTPAMKIHLWLQEPGGKRREVSLTSRIPEGQNVVAGVMLPVVIDPTDPQRISPATPESMKRIHLTGSREQRRQMRKQGM